MPDRMPERMSEYMPESMLGQIECQIESNAKVYARKNVRYCQIECQNKHAIYSSRWYARNYVRIVVQGELRSKKAILNDFIFTETVL